MPWYANLKALPVSMKIIPCLFVLQIGDTWLNSDCTEVFLCQSYDHPARTVPEIITSPFFGCAPGFICGTLGSCIGKYHRPAPIIEPYVS